MAENEPTTCNHRGRTRYFCKTCWNKQNTDSQKVREYKERWGAKLGPDGLRAYHRAAYQRRKERLWALGLTSDAKPRAVFLSEEERKRRKRVGDQRLEARLKQWAFDLFGGRCAGVEERGCAGDDREVLEFDHIDGAGDIERRASGRNGGSFRKIRTEFKLHGADYVRARWQLLCCNCHRRKTRRQMDYLPSDRRLDKA